VDGKRSLKKLADLLKRLLRKNIIQKDYGCENERKVGCEMLI
jgi:hypothetical protein